MGAISKTLLYTSIFISGYLYSCVSSAGLKNSYETSSRRDYQEKISDLEERLDKLEDDIQNARDK